jgi:hypothetical protein
LLPTAAGGRAGWHPYATNTNDLERYQEIRTISASLLEELSGRTIEKIIRVFISEDGYKHEDSRRSDGSTPVHAAQTGKLRVIDGPDHALTTANAVYSAEDLTLPARCDVPAFTHRRPRDLRSSVFICG